MTDVEVELPHVKKRWLKRYDVDVGCAPRKKLKCPMKEAMSLHQEHHSSISFHKENESPAPKTADIATRKRLLKMLGYPLGVGIARLADGGSETIEVRCSKTLRNSDTFLPDEFEGFKVIYRFYEPGMAFATQTPD